MENVDILKWIRTNISPAIKQALSQFPDTIHTEAELAGLTCREVGDLIARYSPLQPDVAIVCSLMRGDYTQRPGEAEKQYHGYGLTQIDIRSFPDFVKSGDWKIPLKCYVMSLKILASNKAYILSKHPEVAGDSLKHYVIAAYNCGAGNESKVLTQHLDPDAYTAGHNYSKAVFEFADQYSNLPPVN
jgi:hypothetical protein